MIPKEAINRSLAEAPLKSPPLYTEVVKLPTEKGQPPYVFVRLENVQPPGQMLSDAVDDSFRALRARVSVETGYDYLDLVGNTFRPMNHVAREGRRRSYHVAGRAVDIDQGPFQQDGNRTVIVRETSATSRTGACTSKPECKTARWVSRCVKRPGI